MSLAVLMVSVVPAAAEPPEGSIRNAHVPNRIDGSYLVVLRNRALRPHAVRSAASTLTGTFGGTVTHSYTAGLRGFAATMTQTQAERMAARSDVAYVEADQRSIALDTAQPNPPSWGLDRIDQGRPPLDNSYSYPSSASSVRAYVVDSGINLAHTDFAGRAAAGYNAIDGSSDVTDCLGHGTHVAGTLGGTTYGVAKGVSLIAVKIIGQSTSGTCDEGGSLASFVAGVDWVTANAVHPAVANLSVGFGDVSTAADTAVALSIASGVSYAVAAGNDYQNACYFSPSDLSEALVVAAIDQNDTKAEFSNWGSCVDVFAPGVNITSADYATTTGSRVLSGTSMAAPHVAGAAALILADHPSYTPAQVQAAINSAADAGLIAQDGFRSPNRLLNVDGTAATTLVLRAAANNMIVTTNGGPTNLSANRYAAGAWEQFDVVDAGGGLVGLRARSNGRYVTAEAAGAAPLVARGTSIGPWEKFKIINNSDGTESLLAAIDNAYVTDSGGTADLIANRTAIGSWEKFVTADPPSTIYLGTYFSSSTGNWVTTSGGASPLLANRTSAGAWEAFDAVDTGDGYVALRAQANGRYVTTTGGTTSLVANRDTPGLWEEFKLGSVLDLTGFVDSGGSPFPIYADTLRAKVNNLYVTCGGSTTYPLAANRPLASQWEEFVIQT